jgi:ABC-type transporter Mla MlaB component
MAKLIVQHERRDSWDLVRLKGALLEGTEDILKDVIPKLGAHCLIDFSGVTHVNSSGIAEWVEFLKHLGKQRVVMLQDCTAPVVDAINLVPMFIGQCSIRSVLVPVACESCSAQGMARMEITPQTRPESGATLRSTCPKCTKSMLPEPEMEEYLSFLAA